MKKFFAFLFVALISVFVFSCSSNGDGGYTNKDCFGELFPLGNMHENKYVVNQRAFAGVEGLYAGSTNCRLDGKKYVNVDREVQLGDYIYVYRIRGKDIGGKEDVYYFFFLGDDKDNLTSKGDAYLFMREFLKDKKK